MRPPWDCRLCPAGAVRFAVHYPAHACRECFAELGMSRHAPARPSWTPYPEPPPGVLVPEGAS